MVSKVFGKRLFIILIFVFFIIVVPGCSDKGQIQELTKVVETQKKEQK